MSSPSRSISKGVQRREIADDAAATRLLAEVDAMITVPNDRIGQVIDPDASALEAFRVVDEVLLKASKVSSSCCTRRASSTSISPTSAPSSRVPARRSSVWARARRRIVRSRPRVRRLESLARGQHQRRARRAASRIRAGRPEPAGSSAGRRRDPCRRRSARERHLRCEHRRGTRGRGPHHVDRHGVGRPPAGRAAAAADPDRPPSAAPRDGPRASRRAGPRASLRASPQAGSHRCTDSCRAIDDSGARPPTRPRRIARPAVLPAQPSPDLGHGTSARPKGFPSRRPARGRADRATSRLAAAPRPRSGPAGGSRPASAGTRSSGRTRTTGGRRG